MHGCMCVQHTDVLRVFSNPFFQLSDQFQTGVSNGHVSSWRQMQHSVNNLRYNSLFIAEHIEKTITLKYKSMY